MSVEEEIQVVQSSRRTTTFRFQQASALGKPSRIEVVFDHKLQRPTALTLRAPEGLRASDMARLPWNTWFGLADMAQGNKVGPVEIIEVDPADLEPWYSEARNRPHRAGPAKARPG